MAVAARPGASDARVPCPLCGGLIHPIAGKCKHCKADLTGYQTARPAASAPLPALHPPSGGNGHTAHPPNGQSSHGAIATAVAPAPEAQPVLPPRPTARAHTVEPRASAWRSWPVAVIIVAMAAIVVAIVLMVWPEGRRGGAGKRTLQPPPAPERMPTVPNLKHPAPDRLHQGAPRTGAAPDPWAPDAVAPAPAPDPDAPDADDADDPDAAALDLFGGSRGSPALRLNRRGRLVAAMFAHLCKKVVECGSDDIQATSPCNQFLRGLPPPPSNCPAAVRCLRHIDDMTCGPQTKTLDHIGALLTQFGDCSEALSC